MGQLGAHSRLGTADVLSRARGSQGAGTAGHTAAPTETKMESGWTGPGRGWKAR